MCGIAGIVGNAPVALYLYEVLSILQHRGQDAAGMATCSQGRMFLHKANGLVRDVFQFEDLDRIVGNMGIGHVRYPTAGSRKSCFNWIDGTLTPTRIRKFC